MNSNEARQGDIAIVIPEEGGLEEVFVIARGATCVKVRVPWCSSDQWVSDSAIVAIIGTWRKTWYGKIKRSYV